MGGHHWPWRPTARRWGRRIQVLSLQPGGEELRERLETTPNEEYQRILRSRPDEVHERLLSHNPPPALRQIAARLRGMDLSAAVRDLGGHDSPTSYTEL